MANAYGLNDTGTGAVNPQFGAGAVSPNMATPPMMAEGGVIPDDEDMLGDDSPNTDITDYTGAMKIVREALNYGRQQHGLPASRPQQANDKEDDSAIPDEPESNDDNQEESTESYAEGGAIEDDDVAAHELEFPDDLPPESEYPPAERGLLQRDIDASNNATPDREQYGRPVVVDDPDAVHPPVSGNNLSEEDIRRGLAATSGDNSGFGPVESPLVRGDDNSGMGPVAALPETPEQGGTPEVDPMGNSTGRGNPQQIMRYLQRADAMPEPQAKALEQSVAPQAGPDKNAITMQAVVAAPTEQDKFAYLQRNAKRYEFALSHARAALEGTRERPANLDAAVASATEAFTNLPDATNVRFQKDVHGVKALVHNLDGKGGEQQYNLSPEQFAKLTNVGGDGQFDKVMAAGGARGVLEQLTGGPAIGGSSAQRAASTAGSKPQYVGMDGPQYDGRPYARDSARQSNRAVQMGYDMTLLKAAPQYKQLNPDWGKAGNANAPVRIKGFGSTPDRTEIAGVDQTPTAQENKLEQIRARNEGRSGSKAQRDYMAEIKAKHEARMEELKLQDEGKTSRATAGIGARTKMAADKLLEQAKERESREGRNAASNAERLLVGKMLNGKELTPEEQALAKQMGQRASQALAPSPRQPAAPAAPQQKQMSAQDQAAIAWANANPTDPRAARIKQLHGIQ